jgi:DNA-binding SARP family transcriptional activator/tetratricopeptide (TPR) repeat protein
MRFGVLGPVEAWDGRRLLAIGGPQQRALLAALLLGANRVVSTDRLVDYLWGERAPATARSLLQGCVAGLRRVLRTAGEAAGERLQTAAPGYLLRVAPGELDLYRFDELVRSAGETAAGGARADLERAAGQLAEALSLWRGPALDDIDRARFQPDVAWLEERWLAVLEERIDLDLRLDRQAGLVSELRGLVRAHPLRERLWAQLMLALYRADRQADALDAYRRLRRRLVEQLGVEPSETVQQLHRTILAGGVASADYAQARGLPIGHRPAATPLPAEDWAPPAQLPAAPAAFTGRSRQLKRLDELLPEPAAGLRVAVISGMAGVGKTSLVLHWAHRARPRFDHGQLYVDLRGYAPSPPVRPIEALAGFLRALGVPGERVPTDLDQATALYRSLLADRRVLVVLDNAGSIEQVRPLLPGSPGCLVLVTSREELRGLVAIEGAAHLSLDVLNPAEARDLLARILGEDRVRPEPDSTTELARLCAYLPLALRVAVADLIVHPGLRIAEQVTQLATGDRLAALAVEWDEQTAVRAAFDYSYTALPADARRLFRLLGLVPGPHITADAAGALAGAAPASAAGLLGRLARAHLVEQSAPDTYVLHDLVRLYAADRAHSDEAAAARQAATGRLFDWYLHSAGAAGRLIYPEQLGLSLPQRAAAPPARFDGHASALAWLEAERPNLLAAVVHTAEHGPRPVAYRLAYALSGFYWRRMYLPEWLAIAEAGLVAAHAEGDQQAEAALETSIGHAHMRHSRYQQAIDHYGRALALGAQAGSLELQARVLNRLGTAHRFQQRMPEAVGYQERALELSRRSGWRAGEAASLGNLATACIDLGRLQQALDFATEASARFRQIGSPGGEAHCLAVMGEAYHLLGRFDEAEDHLTRAHDAVREYGDRSDESEYMRTLAAVYRDAGKYQQALDLAEAARVVASEVVGPGRVSIVLVTLGTIYQRLGQPAQALDCCRRAVEQETEIHRRRPHVVEALIGMATAQLDLGRPAEANRIARQALSRAREGACRVEEGQALVVLATVDLAEGRVDAAVAHANEAVAIQRETGHRLGEARALRELGEALNRRGDTDAATASRRLAYELFTEIGSPAAGTVDQGMG